MLLMVLQAGLDPVVDMLGQFSSKSIRFRFLEGQILAKGFEGSFFSWSLQGLLVSDHEKAQSEVIVQKLGNYR
jgi:hypothetical protein